MSAVTFLLSRRNGSQGRLDRLDQLGGRQDLMRIGWAVNIKGGVIGFRRPGRCGVAYERDVEAEFHSDARRRLNASVGEQAHADDLFLAVALELVDDHRPALWGELRSGLAQARRRTRFHSRSSAGHN